MFHSCYLWYNIASPAASAVDSPTSSANSCQLLLTAAILSLMKGKGFDCFLGLFYVYFYKVQLRTCDSHPQSEQTSFIYFLPGSSQRGNERVALSLAQLNTLSFHAQTPASWSFLQITSDLCLFSFKWRTNTRHLQLCEQSACSPLTELVPSTQQQMAATDKTSFSDGDPLKCQPTAVGLKKYFTHTSKTFCPNVNLLSSEKTIVCSSTTSLAAGRSAGRPTNMQLAWPGILWLNAAAPLPFVWFPRRSCRSYR